MSQLRRKLLFFGLLSIAISLLAGWTALEVFRRSAHRGVDEARNRLRALGYPITEAEYLATIAPPGPDDARPLYAKAIRLIGESPLKPPTEYEAKQAWLKQGKREEMGRTLENAYLLVVEATRKPTFAPLTGQFDEIRNSHERLQLLCLGRAEAASQRGDWTEALGALRTALDVQRHFSSPNLSSYTGNKALESEVLTAFGGFVGRHATSPLFVAEARTWFDELSPPTVYREAFAGEIWKAIGQSRSVSWCGVVPDPTFMDLFSNRREDFIYTQTSAGRDITEAQVLTLIHELVTAPQDLPSLIKARKVVESRVKSDKSTKGFLVWRALNVAFFMVWDDEPYTQRHVLDATLWMLEQWVATGGLPAKWPDDPRFLDPWTGRPFHTATTATRLVVRSFGTNGVHDGTKPYDDVLIAVRLQ